MQMFKRIWLISGSYESPKLVNKRESITENQQKIKLKKQWNKEK